jgi:hypothetical protein
VYNAAITPANYYDVYVWAWDEAGNNAKTKISPAGGLQVLSTYYPDVVGELVGPDIWSVHPSNTWTNQDVKVTATPDPLEPGFYTAIYNGTTQETKSTNIDESTSKVYTAETAGTNLVARLVDTADTAFSQNSPVYVLRIDKTKPVSDVTFNGGPS